MRYRDDHTASHMSHEYFIASRYRNKDTVLDLAQKLREKRKTVYCFIESDASIAHCGTVESDPGETMKKFEATPDWTNDPGVRTIFDSDTDALKASETVILLLPAGKSAHVEAGAAYGFGKNDSDR